MDRELDILLVDDNPQDRMLVLRELKKACPDASVHEAQNQQQLTLLLDTIQFNLVITDFHLHWSNGIEVLNSVKRLYPHCPVIMFTGTGTEEIAVEAMKQGLDDYVVKSVSHLIRLRGAIEAAISNAETRVRAEELTDRLDHLLEQLKVGVFSCSSSGTLIEVNDALLHLVGCSSREQLGETEFSRLLLELNASPSPWPDRRELELQICPPFGKKRVLRINTKRVLLSETDYRIEGLVEDVTLQKQAEERARMTAMAEARLAALSPRESEVMQHVVKGDMNKTIALRMDISEKTVEKHRSNLMRKTGARSVAELVRLVMAVKDIPS